MLETFNSLVITRTLIPGRQTPVHKRFFPENTLYWDQLSEVVKAQKLQLKGESLVKVKRPNEGDPSSQLNIWPDLWYNRTQSDLNPWGHKSYEPFTLNDAAKAVAGEFSNYHQQTFIKWVLGKNNVTFVDLGQPVRCKNDFIGRQVRMGAINAWSLEVVAPVNFLLKWHYGMPRPEEVAILISKGKLTPKNDGVPAKLYTDILSLNLENATNFTA